MRNKIVVLLLASMSIGATCNGRQVAHTVLNVTEAACVLFHEEIEDEATLARACNIAEDLIPEVRKLIYARKSARAMKAKANP